MKREIGQNVFRDANLIPFKGSFNAIRTSLLNIVMTIPFGFGLPFIKEVNLKKIAIYGVLLGISLESLQLIIALIVGFTLRYVDINDVIFNFTGTILGYMLFLGFMSVFKHVVDKYDVEISGLVGYIYYLNN